ncbi:hypothetical protein FTUN_2580 [Frigoriglobus tundricola]|uniref:Uncharacterized protein n=1 Tax=Frigoriglobus tundricola TaxID=2774151 RepID=A0A6M5YNC0_9BACT|nr:hypothetical protein FTUN_2580 [Frigoriglobus tundricola]
MIPGKHLRQIKRSHRAGFVDENGAHASFFETSFRFQP